MPRELFRTICLSPFAATNADYEVLRLKDVLSNLKEEVIYLSDLAEWELTQENIESFQNYSRQLKEVGKTLPSQNNTVARLLNINIDDSLLPEDHGTSGKSRLNMIFGDRVITEIKSWNERIRAAQEQSDKYISQGWKRTVSAGKPRNIRPKINLAAADKQYASIDIIDNTLLVLNIVIKGHKRKLIFDYDKRLRDSDRIALPSITVTSAGKVRFSFSAVYRQQYPFFNEKVVIGVDVGKTNYVTASVIDSATGSIIESTTLSQRVHSLYNKVEKAHRQVSALQRKGRKDEAALHRRANVNRKRELAILAAQEIAELSYRYHNAIVVFEDLSWIDNTMQNGRWNRGELVERTQEMVELNGGRVAKSSAYNTSRVCHRCHRMVVFKGWHVVHCCCCGVDMDRDSNAASNVAQNFVEKGTFKKFVRTRNTSKNRGVRCVKRTKNGGGENLKFPGRKRDKVSSTPKQDRSKNLKRRGLRGGGDGVFEDMCSARNNDDSMVALGCSLPSVVESATVTGSTNDVVEADFYRLL